jgi:hypothetical protein
MIRFSQLVIPSQDPIPADTTNPNFSYDKGGNIVGEGGYLSESKIREIQNNIQSDLQKLDPIIRQNFQSRYNLIKSNQSTNNYQPLYKLYQDVSNEVKKQKIQSLNTIKELGSKIDYMSYSKEQGTYDQLNKIFQEYLKVEMSDEFVSRVSLGEDLKEIVRFFINNATDPKFAKVKQIFKNIPINKWMKISDLITVALCFYLNSQLNKMVTILESKTDQSFSITTVISLINSKMATNSMKIGVALHNLVNNTLLGELLGQLASTALYGIEKFQDYTNTNKSIGELINSTPTTRIR